MNNSLNNTLNDSSDNDVDIDFAALSSLNSASLRGRRGGVTAVTNKKSNQY